MKRSRLLLISIIFILIALFASVPLFNQFVYGAQNLSADSISDLNGYYVNGGSSYDALSDGDICFVFKASSDREFVLYIYDEDSGQTEDSDMYIKPDYYSSGRSYTGTGRWVKMSADIYNLTVTGSVTSDYSSFYEDDTNNTVYLLDANNQIRFQDDVKAAFGSNSDIVFLNRSTSLSADATLTDVIVGTPDHQGIAANSLIFSNTTQNGDVLGLVNVGGNSLEWLNVDASRQAIVLGGPEDLTEPSNAFRIGINTPNTGRAMVWADGWYMPNEAVDTGHAWDIATDISLGGNVSLSADEITQVNIAGYNLNTSASNPGDSRTVGAAIGLRVGSPNINVRSNDSLNYAANLAIAQAPPTEGSSGNAGLWLGHEADNINMAFGASMDADMVWDGNNLMLDYDAQNAGSSSLFFQKNGTTIVSLDENGCFGIGVEDPTTEVEIVGDGVICKLYDNTVAGSANYGSFAVDLETNSQKRGAFDLKTSFNVYTDTSRNSLIEFKTADSGSWGTRMAINGSNVGIGTTSPGGQLDIAPGTTGGFYFEVGEATVNMADANFVTCQVNVPSGSKLIGCQLRVDTALAGGDTWDASYTGGSTQSIASNQAVAQNTKVNKFYDENADSANISSEVDVKITKNGGGHFTAQGTIRAIVYYQGLTAMEDAS